MRFPRAFHRSTIDPGSLLVALLAVLINPGGIGRRVQYIAQHQIERPKLAKLLKRLITVGGQCYSMTSRLQRDSKSSRVASSLSTRRIRILGNEMVSVRGCSLTKNPYITHRHKTGGSKLHRPNRHPCCLSIPTNTRTAHCIAKRNRAIPRGQE